ncbi:hypothetical protein TIFTF001_020005 [Ficus carica]|uniref:RNase H type-1 domain-containing protein n=1 Tax=Ficus carica TaxID=3494 RepID=A0AA88A7Q6_FICCA|nr:hypothetical protein TIFTF001_020005 [Ficus carica]
MFLYGDLDKMWKYFVCLSGVSGEIVIIEVRDKVGAHHSVRRSVRWSPPPGEDLKLNVDAVVRSDSGFFGVGAIIRDAQGVVRACLAKRILEAHSPFVVECLALREGLEFARTCNLRVAWIE